MSIDVWRQFCRSEFLPFAQRSRWFAGKSRCSRDVSLAHLLQCSMPSFFLLIMRVDYDDDDRESYFLPVGRPRSNTANVSEAAVIVRVDRSDDHGTALIDATMLNPSDRCYLNNSSPLSTKPTFRKLSCEGSMNRIDHRQS